MTSGRERITLPCSPNRITTVAISPPMDQGFTRAVNAAIRSGEPSARRVRNPAASGSAT